MRGITAAFLLLALLTSAMQCRAAESGAAPPAPMKQTGAEAAVKSAGCMSCHTTTDSLTMHTSPGVTLGCADCHGGNAGVFRAAVALPTSSEKLICIPPPSACVMKICPIAYLRRDQPLPVSCRK